MQNTSLLIVLLLFSFTSARAQQSNEPAKIELGINFSSLNIGPKEFMLPQIGDNATKTEAGIGARFGYNLTRHVALEAEFNFFPHETSLAINSGGRLMQGQFGVKAGRRFDKFGLFAKGRPGFVSFSNTFKQTGTRIARFGSESFIVPLLGVGRRNFFSFDMGAVVEFYPSRRIVARFDVGDTIMHFGETPLPFSRFQLPGDIEHKFQMSAGVAVRLLNPPDSEDTDSSQSDSTRKFEVGVQFSSLSLREFGFLVSPDETTLSVAPGFGDTVTQSGFGGRLTYNLTPNVGLEVQSDFYPANRTEGGFPGFTGGRTLQFQAGAKIGKRFERFGLFGKARPGAIIFTQTEIFDGLGPGPDFPVLFHIGKSTYFSMDLGGVLEFYPSPRIMVRFDGGDTIIRYGSKPLAIFITQLAVLPTPPVTKHQFQFSAGVGFRF